MSESEGEQSFELGEIGNVIIRRRWWVLLTACTVSFGALAFIRMLPDKYDSEATLIKHQLVSPGYILPVNPITNAEAVEAATSEVLSRSRLINIINKYDLYAKDKGKGAVADELTKRMRRDIHIEPLDPMRPLSETSAFKISFTAEKAELAQSVVGQLVQAFIDANVRNRENRVESTTNFLKAQVEAARAKLAEQELRLQEFKSRHVGELPEQQQGNLLTLTDLRAQLQNVVGNLTRVQQERTAIESSLTGSLRRLQSERAMLLKKYTPRHPEILKKDQELSQIETALLRVKGGSANSGDLSGQGPSEDPVLSEAIKQAEANGREMERLSKEEARLRASIAQYQGRANAAPLREQELTGLQRDYEMLRQDYVALMNKEIQSQLAGSLEQSGEGLQFRLVDPPTLPASPSSPKRVLMNLGGAAAGILLGFVLAFIKEFIDESLHSEKAVRESFTVPLVVGIPLLLTGVEQRKRKWKTSLEWLAGCAIAISVAAAELYVFVHR